MANQFAKKTIDFDVYERADPESQINWGEQAKVISDAFAGIAKDRQERKAAVEKGFADQQAALNELGEYDNPTAQEIMMNAGQDGANKLLDIKNLVQRGLMKPSDATMFQQKQLNGFNLLKKNMANFDKTFQEYTKRMETIDEKTGLPMSAPAEQYLATLTQGFANLNDVSVQTDPITGNVSMLRLDPATGEPVEGGDSMTVNRLTLLMKQKINNFDVGGAVQKIKGEIGITTNSIAKQKYGPNVVITKEMMSKVEDEYLNSEDGQGFLDNKIKQITAYPMNVNTMIINANMQTENGESYKCGSQEDYDKWMAENDNDEANNPFLVLEFGKDNQYHAKFNETQMRMAKDYVKSQIKGAVDYESTQDVKALNEKDQPRAKSTAEISAGKEDEKKSSKMGDYITLLTDPDPEKRTAIDKSLRTTRNAAIEKYNAKVQNEEDKLPLIENVTKGKPPRAATQEDVDNGLAENVGDTVIEDREIILSDGTRVELKGTFTEQVRILESIYDPENQLTTDDIVKLAGERDFDLESEITGGKGKKQKRTQEDIDAWVKENPGKTAADAPFKVGDEYFDYEEEDIKTSKKAFTLPNYNAELQVGDKLVTADNYLNENFGYAAAKDGEFNSSVDTTGGIAEGFEELIIASLDPAILEYFNTMQDESMHFKVISDSPWFGADSVTFQFGGQTYTIGGEKGDLYKNDLFGGNAHEVWAALQQNLLNPVINKANKERTTGKKSDYEL